MVQGVLINYSIIVCTYNREEDLEITLNALLSTNLVENLEIIVVDNNSTDNTVSVVNKFMQLSEIVKYIFEEKQGLSAARNAGLTAAIGDIVIFTDDDVTPANNWLESIVIAFEVYQADLVFGKILPEWVVEKPAWLTERYYPTYALLDYGNSDFIVSDLHHEFFGANFAIKKSTLDEIGFCFNEGLGRTKGSLLMGEETELYYLLQQNSSKMVYIADCLVYHRIEQGRMKKDYVKKWHYDAGISYGKRLKIRRSKYLLLKRPVRFVVEVFCDVKNLCLLRLTFFDFANNMRRQIGVLKEIYLKHA